MCLYAESVSENGWEIRHTRKKNIRKQKIFPFVQWNQTWRKTCARQRKKSKISVKCLLFHKANQNPLYFDISTKRISVFFPNNRIKENEKGITQFTRLWVSVNGDCSMWILCAIKKIWEKKNKNTSLVHQNEIKIETPFEMCASESERERTNDEKWRATKANRKEERKKTQRRRMFISQQPTSSVARK